MVDKSPIETLPQHEWDAFIGSIVKRYQGLYTDDALINREDLQQEAWIALLKATQEYDPEKGTKFTTFAHDCIRYHLYDFVSRRTLKKPTQVNKDPFDTEFDIEGREPPVGEAIKEHDLVSTIFNAISHEEHAHLLREHFIDDRSYRVLAKKYGVSHETIGTRIHKLLAMLEKRIDKSNG
jgi:RNA polymerase sigma factor (sigma-70 family)